MVPKITVIMGVYNCKNFDLLRKSVNSIVNQTFSDWEFLICDDGSTNNTYDFLKQIEQIDNRIKILHYDKNVSLANALNFCLQESKGEYIARQDDDDVSKINRLEKEVLFLDSYSEYSMVGCCAEVYDNLGKWGHYKVPEKPTKYDFLRTNPFMHPTMLFRKESIMSCGGYRVAKETKICEDYDLFMRMYSMNMKGYNLQDELYEYRIVRDNKKKHRPMKYRIDEMEVRWKGFRELGILGKGLPFIIKPLIAGLLPTSIFSKVQYKQYYDA